MKSKGMRIAGGILALVASLGGGIAGLVTVVFGAAAKAFGESDFSSKYGQASDNANMSSGGNTVMILGWLGILASFIALILGIVVLCSKSQKPAWILLACSILGIFLGGAFVAFFMVLAVIGAVFALVGGKKVAIAA